jgi:hypothetical protein
VRLGAVWCGWVWVPMAHLQMKRNEGRGPVRCGTARQSLLGSGAVGRARQGLGVYDTERRS